MGRYNVGKRVSFILIMMMLIAMISGCGSAEFNKAMESGKQALSEGKYDDAIEYFQKAVELKPNNEEAKKALDEATKKKDFKSYIEAIAPTMQSILEISTKWDSLRQQSAQGLITDIEFGIQTMDLATRMRQAVEELESISLNLKEPIKSIHELLISSAEQNVNGFTEVIAAIDQGDYSKITSANNYLSEARKYERQYVDKLQELAKEIGIDINELLPN